MKRSELETLYGRISDTLYGIAGTMLMLVSFSMIVLALWNVVDAIVSEQTVGPILDSISFIVIGIAVFDVGKYLIDEEVFRERELSSPTEARRALTKFLAILIIAVSLEALMFVFEAGKRDVTTLIYPTGLLVAVALIVVALGLYQRMSKSVEAGGRRPSSQE